MPVFDDDVVVRKGTFVERDGNFFFFTRFQEDFHEAFEFLFGTEDGGFDVFDVNLRDFRSVDVSRVLDFEGGNEFFTLFDVGRGKSEVGVFEIGVRKTVTERIHNRFLCGVEISVTDVNAFAVLHRTGTHREITRHDVVAVFEGECFGKFTGGIDFAVKQSVCSFADSLSAEIHIEYCFGYGFDGRELYGRAAGENDDDVGVDLCDFLGENDVGVGHIDMLAVEPFGFVVGRKSDEEQNDVFTFCGFDCFFHESGFVAVALECITVGVFVFLTRGVHGLQEGSRFDGVDVA